MAEPCVWATQAVISLFFTTLREKLTVRWLHTYVKTWRACVGAVCAGEKGQLCFITNIGNHWKYVTPISNKGIDSPPTPTLYFGRRCLFLSSSTSQTPDSSHDCQLPMCHFTDTLCTLHARSHLLVGECECYWVSERRTWTALGCCESVGMCCIIAVHQAFTVTVVNH